MRNIYHLLLPAILIFTCQMVQAQVQFRSMIDAPNVYLVSKDLLHIPNQDGVGLDFGWGLGTHFLMIKPIIGIDVTADFGNQELVKTLTYNPYGKLELGLGKWRSNGQRCAKTNAHAYTLLLKGGIKYNFGKRDANPEFEVAEVAPFLDYYVAGEFGNFFIKDMRKNTEFYIQPGWSFKSETLFLEVGIRNFINTLAKR